MRLLPIITDARGNPVRTSVALWGPTRKHSDELTRGQARTIERGMRSDPAPPRRMVVVSMLVAMPLFLLPAVLILLLTRYAGGRAIWWAIPGGVVLGTFGPLAMMLTLRSLMLPRIVRAYVRAGFCGACGFPLEGQPREDDGCVICPECGAAWNTP